MSGFFYCFVFRPEISLRIGRKIVCCCSLSRIEILMKKRVVIYSLIILVILSIGLYIQYGKYFPTLNTTTDVLTIQQIQKIRIETPITEVRVNKSERTVKLMHQEQTVRTYPMRLGFDPVGHKQQEGDGKTPEGRYRLDWRNAQSAFYKSLHVSYPNQYDQQRAQQLGVSPGGDIMIHGSASQQQLKVMPSLMDYLPRADWTLGCIAVKNVDMDEIWQLVDNGTVIEILP